LLDNKKYPISITFFPSALTVHVPTLSSRTREDNYSITFPPIELSRSSSSYSFHFVLPQTFQATEVFKCKEP